MTQPVLIKPVSEKSGCISPFSPPADRQVLLLLWLTSRRVELILFNADLQNTKYSLKSMETKESPRAVIRPCGCAK
ncbi:unnamed protein product [Calypogeia fissa]